MSSYVATAVPGIYQRGNRLQIKTTINGVLVNKATGLEAGRLQDAKAMLEKLRVESRNGLAFSHKAPIWQTASDRFRDAYKHKKSWKTEEVRLNVLDRYFHGVRIDKLYCQVDSQTVVDAHTSVQRLIADLQRAGRADRTIDIHLELAGRVLRKCHKQFRNADGTPLLGKAPLFSRYPVKKQRKGIAISWGEQESLLGESPAWLQEVILFLTNTGLRDAELRALRWDWEVSVEGVTAFKIPGPHTKNGRDHLVLCNSVASQVIERQRGKHPVRVFTRQNERYADRKDWDPRPEPIQSGLSNRAWKKARKAAGLSHLHVHDLRHTFSTRLEDLGVEDKLIKRLMNHTSNDVTDRYSVRWTKAQVKHALSCLELITEPNDDSETLFNL